jgi:hypothetical protein
MRGLWILLCAIVAAGQQAHAPAGSTVPIAITVIDENGAPVPAAQVTILEPAQQAVHLFTD